MRREIGCGRIVLLYPRGILRSFKKCMCVCVCVCVWGGQINKWAIYMDVLSLHDEIRTALLYGERARAMYAINSRCASMLYQLWGQGWWYIFPPYLHIYNCDKCVYLVKWSLPPHKQQVVLPSPYLCMWTMDLHWLSLVILKESHQKVPI